MARDYKIPFFKTLDGHMCMQEYPYWNQEIEWRDNIIFQADLVLQDCYRGRSAARVRVKNLSNGEHYSMGFTSFFDTCKLFKISKGKITGGTYTFRKQGSNYGLVPISKKSS